MRWLTLIVMSLTGCAAMHTVTGDEMFRPEPQPVVRGPVVPEPEPQDEQYQAELKEAQQPSQPAAAATAAPEAKKKKKEPKLAIHKR